MKTALITGAARGIGLATTDILCAKGWHVVMVDRDAEELMARASERHAVTAAVHDISDPDQVDKMIAVTLLVFLVLINKYANKNKHKSPINKIGAVVD